MVACCGCRSAFRFHAFFWRGLPLAWLGCLLCFVLGQGLFQSALEPALPAHHVRRLPQNTPLSLQGMVASRPLAAIGGDLRFELAATSCCHNGAWQPACGTVLVSGLHEPSHLRPGDQVVACLSLWPVADLANPGSPGRKLALARRQIFVTGKLWQHHQPVPLVSPQTLSWLAARREQARDYCRRLLDTQPQPARSIFLALLLGDQTEISQPLRQAFNRTGTTHVLSVSGLHLVILAAFFAAVFFWLLRRSAWLLLRLNALKLSVFLATLPIIGYVWLAENSPATNRSAVMILAYMLLVLLDRHRDVYSALTLAALIILVDSPLQLYSVSFQLSFLAVWGLAYLSPSLLRPWQKLLENWENLSLSKRKSVLAAWGLAFSTFPVVRPWQNWLIGRMDIIAWLNKAILWLGEAWSVSLAATLATLPIIVANFHQAPTYGILVNIVVTPLIGGIAVIIVFLSLLLSFLPLPIASALLYLGRLVIDFSVYLMAKAAALPGVVVRLPAPTLWQTVAYFLILVSLLKAPQRLWRWTGTSLGVLILLLSLAWSGVSPLLPSGLVLTVLDTPREMALVADFPGGTSMVVDAGHSSYFHHAARSNSALLSFLHFQRRRGLDFLAALTVTEENAGTLLALAREFRGPGILVRRRSDHYSQFLGTTQSLGRCPQGGKKPLPGPARPGDRRRRGSHPAASRHVPRPDRRPGSP